MIVQARGRYDEAETLLRKAIAIWEQNPGPDRLRLAVADEPFLVGTGDKLPVTISIGLAITGQPEDTLEALLKRVDDALYAAKNGGRNRVVAAPHRPTSSRGMPVAVAS